MNPEQFEYTIGELKAVEIYPFTKTQKIIRYRAKRYFIGYNINTPDEIYRIVVYPHSLVKVQQLITNIKMIKNIIHHNILGKILNIYQNAILCKICQKQSQQNVIAVVLEDHSLGQFICLYDFIVQMGHLSEKLAKDFVYTLLNFIRFMEQNGFVNCFNSNDILIEKRTGKIKIDNYGDSCHFLLKEQKISDVWQLGAFLFTILKGNPPYNKKTQSDPHYNCLNKGQFQKFWGLIPEKPVQNPDQSAINFMNACFDKQSSIAKMLTHQWLNCYIPLREDEKLNEVSSIIQVKHQKLQIVEQQQRLRKQKMNQAARDRSCLIQRRGTQQQLIQTFLDQLIIQQEQNRELKKVDIKQQQIEKIKIKIAQILTILALNQNKDVKIYDIQDKNNVISFKINTELADNIIINSKVQYCFDKFKDNIRFYCQNIQGTFFQCLWINNYLKELFMQI